MAKNSITTQIDAIFAMSREALGRLRKKTFQLYVQGLQPLFANLKHGFKHSPPKTKHVTHNFTKQRFLLWLGIATGVTGLLVLINPAVFVSWQLFIIPLIAVIGPWVVDFFRESSKEAKDTLESYDGREFIGKFFILKTAIVNGESELVISDKSWRVKGEDCPEGTRVRVIAVNDDTIFTHEVS